MADELNDAVIARLMAGDDPQDYDDGGEDSDDPDYGMELKKKAKKGAKRGRPKKAAAAPAAGPPAQQRQPAAPPQQQLAPQQLPHPAAMVALAQQQQAAGGAAAPPVQLPPGAFALPPGISLQQAALMGAFPNLLPMAVPMAAVAAPGGPAAGAQQPAAAPAAQQLPPQQQAPQHVKQDMEQLVNDVGDEVTATGRRKRKDTGKQRQHSRSWTEEEEQLFVEALELYGRDWKKCAEHVRTRDHRAFTSHAQKHFIKLLLRGEEVPEKVAETGRGYTLSGKPLDPNSASAAAYGLKPDLFADVCKSGRLKVGVHVTTFEMSEEAAAARKASSKAGKGASPAASGAGPSNKRQRRGKSRLADDDDEEETDEDAEAMASLAATTAVPGQRTEYARNRPRREAVGQRAKVGETTESLELTHLNDFVGPPGTGAPLSQPFAVQVESQALLVADFHAHLSRCEIIGLLGGTFDPERRVMEIKEAFPCRRAAGSDSSTSVELDAESQVEATAAMEERGLVPVGWYHSHPIFEPRPSAKDNENQRNYQAMFRDASTGLEPWVGLIVGPYDQALETPASRTQLWVVRMKDGQLTPYGIRSGLSVGIPGDDVQQKIEEALEQLQEDVGRVDLSEPWRPYTHLVGGQPSGEPMTKIQKLRASLLQHLPRDEPQAVASFLDGVTSSIEAAWGISLSAAAPAAAAAAAAPAAAAAGPATAAGPVPPPGGGLPPGMMIPKMNAPGLPAGMTLPIMSGPGAGLPPMALPGMGALPGMLPGGGGGEPGGLVITAAHHQLLSGAGQ